MPDLAQKGSLITFNGPNAVRHFGAIFMKYSLDLTMAKLTGKCFLFGEFDLV